MRNGLAIALLSALSVAGCSEKKVNTPDPAVQRNEPSAERPAADGGEAGDPGANAAGDGGSGANAARGGSSAENAGRGGGKAGAGSPAQAGRDAGQPGAGRPALDAAVPQDLDAGPGEPPACRTPVSVRANGTATVWLVIDASGSMLESFGTSTRWEALHQALLEPSRGLVKSLESQLRWGLILFDGPAPNGNMAVLPDGGVVTFPVDPAATCPRIQTIEPQPNNYAALSAAFPMLPLGGSTPTDKALNELLMRYGTGPAVDEGPVSIVLATDGAPNDLCTQGGFLQPPPDVRPFVVANVKQLLARGITTYTLSLAYQDQQLMQHLSEVAAAGGTGKPVFTPEDLPALSAALQEIVGKENGCSFRLSSRIALARACEAHVELNGEALACNDPNGFLVHDAATLQLSGRACERYRAASGAKLGIDVPCNALER